MKPNAHLSIADAVHGWSFLKKHSHPDDGRLVHVPITDATYQVQLACRAKLRRGCRALPSS
jgi:hypothetical protein